MPSRIPARMAKSVRGWAASGLVPMVAALRAPATKIASAVIGQIRDTDVIALRSATQLRKFTFSLGSPTKSMGLDTYGEKEKAGQFRWRLNMKDSSPSHVQHNQPLHPILGSGALRRPSAG